MQTLSLKTSQSAQKNLPDVVNKSESNLNGLTASNEKTPFHHELAKQVHAKKQPSQAVQARPVNPQSSINSQNKTAQNTQAARNAVGKDHAASVQSGDQDANLTTSSELDSISQMLGLQMAENIVDSRSVAEAKSDKDFETDELARNQEADVTALAGAAFIAPGLVTAALRKQGSAAQPADERSEINTTMADSNSTLSSSLIGSDAAKPMELTLSNSLSQSKDANMDIAAKGIADHATGKADESAKWLDSVLEKTSRNATRDELALNKASSSVLSEISNKEIVATAAAATQSQALQANQNIAATQQIAGMNIIQAYPGKTGWDQAISQKVIWMVGAGEQTASLTLNPPDMGPLKVVIHVHNDQADTTFISDNDEVRRALEDGFSNLRDRMNESGIQLGQANVSTSSQSQQNFQQAAQSRTVAQTQGMTNAQQTEVSATHPAKVSISNGLVDTFA